MRTMENIDEYDEHTMCQGSSSKIRHCLLDAYYALLLVLQFRDK